MSLKSVVESRDTRAGILFDIVVQVLILISLVSFMVETLPGLPPHVVRILRSIEVVTVACFSVEYILRLAAADCWWRYALSFFGIIDLAAILPFYLATGIDLRSLRALRFLRIFQLLKLARYSRAIRRLHVAVQIAKEEIVLFGVMATIALFLSAVGIYYFERNAQPEAFASIFHSLWWAVITLTTVGYGDVVPITVGGRVFTLFVLVVGLGIVAAPAGLIASALSAARELEKDGDAPA